MLNRLRGPFRQQRNRRTQLIQFGDGCAKRKQNRSPTSARADDSGDDLFCDWHFGRPIRRFSWDLSFPCDGSCVGRLAVCALQMATENQSRVLPYFSDDRQQRCALASREMELVPDDRNRNFRWRKFQRLCSARNTNHRTSSSCPCSIAPGTRHNDAKRTSSISPENQFNS